MSGTRISRAANTKKMVMLAMLSAFAFVAVAVGRIPVVLFLSYEPKDVVIAIGGFIFGPLSALAISLVVSLVEMLTISSTGFIGFLMNVLATCAFACTASLIYKKIHSIVGAAIGLLCGSILMVAAMLLWNFLLTPLYMGTPRAEIAAMLVPVFLPFNLLKAGLNTALTLLLYKPVVLGLRRAALLGGGTGQNTPSRSSRIAVWIGAGVLLVSCILLVLVMQGKL
ncbi:MAG: ECF transporter S component [Oscillospiraceae bacterium]|jgi:riboflavin transporter FmnP|nr:ECF transporter S component [Oscillospiraceae bacterium]